MVLFEVSTDDNNNNENDYERREKINKRILHTKKSIQLKITYPIKCQHTTTTTKIDAIFLCVEQYKADDWVNLFYMNRNKCTWLLHKFQLRCSCEQNVVGVKLILTVKNMPCLPLERTHILLNSQNQTIFLSNAFLCL